MVFDLDMLLEELEYEYDNKPVYDNASEVDVLVEGDIAYVRMYRGSDTDAVHGITWWTTDKKLAMGTYYNGVLLERVLTLPVVNHIIANPSGYVLGNRDTHIEVGPGYSYGIDEEVDVRRIKHFNISIHMHALTLCSI